MGQPSARLPRPQFSFPGAWWGLQEITSELSTFPGELGGGGVPFVLRYQKPLVMLFILEVPGVTDDTLTCRLVPQGLGVLSGTVLSSSA